MHLQQCSLLQGGDGQHPHSLLCCHPVLLTTYWFNGSRSSRSVQGIERIPWPDHRQLPTMWRSGQLRWHQGCSCATAFLRRVSPARRYGVRWCPSQNRQPAGHVIMLTQISTRRSRGQLCSHSCARMLQALSKSFPTHGVLVKIQL